MKSVDLVNSVKKTIYDESGNEVGWSLNMTDLAEASRLSSTSEKLKGQLKKSQARVIDRIANLKIGLQALKSQCNEIERKGFNLRLERDKEAMKIAKKYQIDKFITASNMDMKKIRKYILTLDKPKARQEAVRISKIYNDQYIPDLQVIEDRYKLSGEEISLLKSYNDQAMKINEMCLSAQREFKDIDFSH
ncbi:hypothetical protein [Polynucleobacter sp. 80A-SIGWE]|uniref:hypothetical protein n=1 Tax=Polynucleobacter sp. 80A-SIGWE TaxID=2689100 RepID=UPI001C0BA5DC|nr:hypothetical protein [Polynucleobacter sp. 80A-SIGWE]MBU3588517.1 hypothetical protein [Polynucleobacter sp. 80A-SIGWE]